MKHLSSISPLRIVRVCVLFILAFSATRAGAQVATFYTFTQNVSTYTPITGGTVWLDGTSPSMNDEISPAVTIPSFWYDGTFHTSIYISTNGFLVFGGTAPTATEYNPISSVQLYDGCVSPFGADMDAAGSGTPEIRYEQVGSEFVVQWQDMSRTSSPGEIISFQVRLDTSTHVINVVYGGTITPGASVSNPQVGIRGPNNSFAANVNNRRHNAALGAWVNSVAGITNTNRCFFNSSAPASIPAPGTTFTWTPGPLDMAAVSLISPLTGICYTANETVSVEIRNDHFSTIDFSVDPVIVNCNITGVNPVSFTPVTINTGTLAAGASQAVTFSTTYDMSAPGSYTFDASVFVFGDNNTTNDLMPGVNINASAPIVALGADITQCGGIVVPDAQNAGSTYLWSTGETTQTISVSANGTYSVVVTDVNGCTGSDTIGITINPNPVVALGPDVTQCGGSVTLDAQNAGMTFLWNTTETSQTISVSSTGTYSVVVTDGNGCTGSDDIDVTIHGLPLVTLGPDVTQCAGTVVLDAGNSGSSFLWSTTETTQTISVSAGGTYSVVVTDVNGCTGNDAIDVTINPLPVVNLGPDVVQCGGSVTLDAQNAGSTYLWSTGATTQTINVIISGTYTVTVTDANGCSNTDAVDVTIHTLPTVDLGPDVTQCAGTVTIDAGTPGATYSWSTGATTQQITVSTSGNYSVVITDANGCTANDNIDITINPLPTVDLGPNIAQCGGSVVLDAGNPGATYLWGTNETTQTITVSAGGTYSVVVTDANGCSNSDAVTVNINSSPTVNLGADVTQCGGSVTLNAQNSGASYSWSTGETTQTIIVAASGTYSVVVTDANGCTGNDAVNVTINALPAVNLGPDVAQCGGSVTLDAGNAGATYLWGTSETTQAITVSASGTYSVVVTDANGCSANDAVVVTINAVPVVNLGADITSCGSATLDAQNAGSTYLWSTGAITQTISVPASGTYSVVVTNASGCSANDAINVTINALPVVNLGPDVTQCGGTATLDAGNAGATYLWGTAETTQAITVSVTGTYSVVVTDANGCTGSDAADVTIHAIPVVALGADIIQCGGSVTLDAGNPGATYSWSTGATTQTISVTTSGTYSVAIVDANGCTANDAINITINPNPVVSFGPDISQCGGTVTLDAQNPGTTYLWSTTETTQTITVSASGTYSVVVTDANGCTGTDAINIAINTSPVVALGPDITQCGGPVTLDAQNAGATYLWSTTATTQTINVAASGTYSVVVTDANGCTANDAVTVTINPNPVVALGSDITQCGGSVTLDAQNAGATFAWSTTATTQTINVAASGTYSVVVTDANGCTGNDAINVTINTVPVVALGPDITQCGGTVALDAQNAGATYLWSTAATTQTISVAASGTYSVVVTDANGCTANDAVNITINPNPVVALGSDITQCGGSVTLDAQNAGATFAWSTTATTQTINVAASGTYSVVVTDANGCTDNDAINVTINTAPVVALGPDITQCGGPVTLDAQNAGATYLWSTSATTQTISVPASGTYSVVVTDANGCTASDAINITINANPVVALGPDISQCGGTATLDAQNAGATYAWTTGATTQTITVSSGGTFGVTVTNANGCTASDAINVAINGFPVVALGPDVTQCSGSVTLDAQNAGATYLWSTAATTQTISVSASGTYSVVVTDANGCSSNDAINITINPSPVVALGADVTQCGGTVTLDAQNAGFTYLWNTTATTQTITVSATGTYSVLVTGTNGCTGSDVINVTINAFPVVALGTDVTLCGGTVTLDAGNAGSTYLWNTTAATQTINVTASGTYSVVVTDANGCSGNDAINVTINPNPVVALGADITQCGGSVTLDAQNAGANYIWGTGETTQTITVSAGGTYSVVVTDANGCTGNDAINVTINANPVVALGADITQCGGTVTLDAQNSGATYSWSTAETTQTINVSTSGTYAVTVTDANGCAATDTINVTINANPVVTLGTDIIQCGGSATLDAGNPGATYLWGTGATTQTITVSAGGTYSVVVTDANGCTATDAINVTINANPVVTLGADVTQCGGTVTLDAQNAGSTYLWSTAATTQTISVSASGTYSVVVTDANGCSGNDAVNVTINTLPVVALGADIVQCGGTVTLDAQNAGATYLWNTTATTQAISVTANGTYSVVVTDVNGCTGNDIINVTINALPVVSLGADITQCGGTATLDAQNAGATYLWNDNSTLQNLTASSTGTYWVDVTDVNGCTSRDSINVTIHALPVVSLGADVVQCGDSVTLDAQNAGATYSWSTTATTQTITVAASGSYDVAVTDINGCTSTDTIAVTINALPVVALGADITQCGGTATLDAQNAGATYLWNDNSTAQTLTASSTGTFWVDVTDVNGCTSRDSINVTIHALPVVSLGADVVQCGDSVTLDAQNAGATYSWSTTATTQTITVAATGSYDVAVTDINGCTSTDTIVVTINAPPVVAIADIILCGDSALLDAQNAGATFLWNTGATTQTINVAGGVYDVTVTDASGCIASDTVSVTIHANPVVSLGADSTQCGGTITLDAQNAGSTYLWNDNSTAQTLAASASGIYHVDVTDTNGCVSRDSVAITINAVPVVNLGADITQCGGAVTLDAQNPGATYLWNSSATSQTVNVTATNIYSVLVTGTNGCSGADTISVTIHTVPTVMLLLPFDTLCLNDGALALSGGSPAGGTWSGPGVSGSMFDATTTGVGNKLITYLYTDSITGCSGSASQVIVVELCSGVEETIVTADVLLYPNPFITSATVKITGATIDPASSFFIVYDLSGREVQSQQVTSNEFQFNRNELSAGVYIYRIISDGNVVADGKLVIE